MVERGAKVFRSRADAGRRLALALSVYARTPGLLVLGVPRGGIVVGYQVASLLGAPLDVLVARKLGLPGHKGLAMGAVAPLGVRLVDREVVRRFGVSGAEIDGVLRREERERERREQVYRRGRTTLELAGKTVILVDDGLATGATAQAAVRALRKGSPRRLIFGVPVGARAACEDLAVEVDDIECLVSVDALHSVGSWYEDFPPVSDQDVLQTLGAAEQRAAPATKRHEQRP